MANFSKPFSEDNVSRRNPSASEQCDGFECGDLDLDLFNGMFHRIEAEIGEVVNFAGIASTNDRNTFLREAIESIAINAAAAATGSIPTTSTDGFLSLTQATSRLPIFPEIQTADNRINVSSPAAGTVRIPSGVTFTHRGIENIVTTQQDFATSASTIYHVRWSPTNGYELLSLSDASYNPSSLAETDTSFDSDFDSMLIARVITNSSNIPVITNLSNAHSLSQNGESANLTPEPFTQSTSANLASSTPLGNRETLNWARNINVSLSGFRDYFASNNNERMNLFAEPISRYQIAFVYQRDNNPNEDVNGTVFNYTARA